MKKRESPGALSAGSSIEPRECLVAMYRGKGLERRVVHAVIVMHGIEAKVLGGCVPLDSLADANSLPEGAVVTCPRCLERKTRLEARMRDCGP